MLEEALDGRDDEESPLHVKLLARLATALYYQGGTATRRANASERAVAMARRIGDRRSLAYALHARHFTLWGPGNPEERLEIATELVRLADALRDEQMAFDGHFARFCDQLELGNGPALAVELQACERVGKRRDPYQRLHMNAMRAVRALVAGHWEDTTAVIGDVQELHQLWPHNDVWTLLGFVLWGVARLRGGTTVFIPSFEQGVVATPGSPLPRCILAALYAEAGRMDDARREYEIFVPDELGRLPRELSLALSLSQLAETCRELEDARGAEALYAALLPFADLCVTSAAMGFFGAVSLYLGMLATMQRRWGEATRHFEHALGMHERMGAAPWLVRTRYEHAAMLLARGKAGDVQRAGTLLAAARQGAGQLGMEALRARMNALIGPVEGRGGEPAAGEWPGAKEDAVTSPRPNVFRREGEYWTIVYAGAAVRLRDTKGLHYIAHLLAHPAREIHVADLATLGGRPDNGARGHEGMSAEGDLGAVLDPRATAEYKDRLVDLRGELDEATTAADAARVERARHEIELVTHELAAAYGLGGRARRAGDPVDRIRKAVTNQIRRVVERIRAGHPALARHLENGLRTGFTCAYRPERQVDWQL